MRKKQKRYKKKVTWNQYDPPYEIGINGLIFKDVVKDYDGWVDCRKFLPLQYELVSIKTGSKTRTGWWNGKDWEGVRIHPDDEILYWKSEEGRFDV